MNRVHLGCVICAVGMGMETLGCWHSPFATALGSILHLMTSMCGRMITDP